MSDLRVERARTLRCIRRLIVLTSAVGVAFGTAAPAFASAGDEGESIATAVLSTVASATEPAPQPSTTAAPSVGAEEPTTTSEEEAVLDTLGQIVTAVESDPGNVNVSVRVLSPGADEPVTQENPASSLISSEPEADITAPADTGVEETSAEEQSSPSPSTVNTNVAIRVLSPGTNGEVSQQNATTGAAATDGSDTAEEGDADLREVEPSAAEGEPTNATEPGAASPGDTELGLLDSGTNSDGYQQDDLQYQSDSPTLIEAWYWSWSYTIDCDGNATTSSTESGSPSSLDWTWEWMWDWSCTDGGAGVSAPDSTSSGSGSSGLGDSSPATSSSGAGNTNVSIRVLSPGDNGPVSQTTTSSPAPTGLETTGTARTDEPWNWSWTFTFCDQTTALVTQAPSGTPLSWTWEWAWNWSCDAAVGPPPSLSDTAQPGTVADPPPAGSDVMSDVISAPLEAISDSSSEPQSSRGTGARLPGLSALAALPSLAGLGLPGVEVAVKVGVAIVVEPQLPTALVPQGSLPSPTVPGVDVSVAVVTGASDTLTSEATSPPEPPFAPVGRKPRGRAAPSAPSAPGSTIAPRTTTTTSTSTWQPSPGPGSRVATKPAVKHPSARPAPPDRPRGLFSPFGELGTSQGAGAGTTGALVPSAPVVAVAALTALFVLVAPGPGRRIRLARELSPRGTYRSSIDHPG